MITVKFGGTSLADARGYRQAAQILHQDTRRRYAVVSAPGKRWPEDEKITDLLLRYHDSRRPEDLAPVEGRFREIARDLGVTLDLDTEFANLSQPHSLAYMASWGEYLSAQILAAYLGWPFVDARKCILFEADGQLSRRKTEAAIFDCLKNLPNAVIPGYYGVLPDGEIHTFPRGGSDVTGALVARAMECRVYENWTDVDGMLATDPRIVPNAASIGTITYSELRELAYQGATVLHEDAVLPVKELGIPIHICNTFRPEGSGSWIRAESGTPGKTVTGIAGKKGYSTIQIERENTNNMVGYVRRILSCLERLDISFEHIATGVGSVCLVAPTAAIAHCQERLERDIRRAVKPDSLQITSGLAMIAVVGRGMNNTPGAAARLFAALGAAGISVRVIDMGCSEMNIVVGVAEEQYEAAVTAIYHRFFSEP